MSTFNYARMAATAKRLIAKFGSLGVVGDAGTARNVMMVRSKIVKHVLLDSDIQVGDIEYIVNATTALADGTDTGVDVAPKNGERFSFKGEQLNIIQSNAIKPDAIVLYYQFFGRIG